MSQNQNGGPNNLPQNNGNPTIPTQNYDYIYDYIMDLCSYLHIYFDILGAVTLVLFIFLMYLVYFVTPKELSYMVKMTLINTVVMNFLVVFVYFIWQPVPLFPYLGGFSISILKYLGTEGQLLGMNLWSITITGLLLAILMCQTSKVVLFQPPGPITNFLLETKNLVGTYILLFLVNAVVSVGTLRMAVAAQSDVKTRLDPTIDQGGYSYRMFLQLATRSEVNNEIFKIYRKLRAEKMGYKNL
jgi:hypothetical protein